MKNKIYLIMFCSFMVLNSCDLERDLVTEFTEEEISRSMDYVKTLVSSVYAELPSGFLYIDGAMMASATDEAEHTLETSEIQRFNTGDWNSESNPDDVWQKYFRAIRKANKVLFVADSIDLDGFRLNPDPAQQLLYKFKLEEIERWKYEVRFLRAYFYFELAKRYGAVPVLDEALTLEDDFLNISRGSLGETFEFIVSECDSCSAILPVNSVSADLGRVTKGAALALKSRVLLYKASDLFNTPEWAGGFGDPALISLPEGDRIQRWTDAAEAARAVINMGAYTLSGSYSGLFNTFTNPEHILVTREGSTNEFEQASYPIGYDLGRSGTTPSGNLVDMYEVIDTALGLSIPFDWSNPVHAADPYNLRDPRLSYSILTNNTMFKGRPVECWTGGLDGKGKERATRTGYYLRKYVSEGTDLLQDLTSVHTWINIRLAEIYLNYAEALNEYEPGNPDIKIFLDLVRTRPDVGMPPVQEGLSQEEMRIKIRNERMVELAFEDHRIWDLRRWMTAPEVLSTPIEGVVITMNADSTFTYKKVIVEQRVFTSQMYFYPVPYNEVQINNNWVQNPNW